MIQKIPLSAADLDNPLLRQPLETSEVFQNVDLAHLAEPLSACHWVDLESEALLLDPATPNDTLYVVITGQLQVRVTRKDSEALAQINAGHCIGEVSFLDGSPPSAFVVASQTCRLLAVNREVLRAMLMLSSTLCLNLMRIQADRFRDTIEKLRRSRETEMAYRVQAETDPMTGLYNRAWCDQVMRAQLALSERSHLPSSLVMLDIDKFKSINDQFGHLVGDQFIVAVAQLLKLRLRNTDYVARYGGDEFMILMSGTELPSALEVMEQIRIAASQLRMEISHGGRIGCTLSIGVAQHVAGQTLEELMSQADQALYQAKEAGRNCVRPEIRRS